MGPRGGDAFRARQGRLGQGRRETRRRRCGSLAPLRNGHVPGLVGRSLLPRLRRRHRHRQRGLQAARTSPLAPSLCDAAAEHEATGRERGLGRRLAPAPCRRRPRARRSRRLRRRGVGAGCGGSMVAGVDVRRARRPPRHGPRVVRLHGRRPGARGVDAAHALAGPAVVQAQRHGLPLGCDTDVRLRRSCSDDGLAPRLHRGGAPRRWAARLWARIRVGRLALLGDPRRRRRLGKRARGRL
mmetsp:Transcript_121161/g.386973  ORF Transcript_121161/g.386973 Transcript_121161/m.386973 type:complete len:241 (+) Transcript_121161:462-1184(+)